MIRGCPETVADSGDSGGCISRVTGLGYHFLTSNPKQQSVTLPGDSDVYIAVPSVVAVTSSSTSDGRGNVVWHNRNDHNRRGVDGRRRCALRVACGVLPSAWHSVYIPRPPAAK